MAILAKKTGGEGAHNLGPLAPGGVHQAVCVDVIDLGMITSTFEGKARERHMVLVVWQLQKRDPQTNRRYLVGKRYTLSLSEKATLRHDLESWRGKPFSREEEMQGFDVERIKGKNCMVNVQQVTKQTGTYANVIAIMPKFDGAAAIVADGYQRSAAVVEEPEIDDDTFSGENAAPASNAGTATGPAPVTADDIPF